MKKFFPIYDVKAIDRRTTELQGIDYIQLVDRAARALCEWIVDNYTRRRVVVLSGPGNNGADGLALAALLIDKEWVVDVHTYTGHKGYRSECNEECLERLRNAEIVIDENVGRPEIPCGALVVDAIFGTGLKRDLEGPSADVVKYIAGLDCDVLSVDIPSGLGNEDSYLEADSRAIVCATHTLSFQFPKMAFFLPELTQYVGRWHVLDIKLPQQAVDEAPTFMFYSNNAEAAKIIRPRDRFAHKGTMGHALLFAGSEGMSGAAVLASRSTLRAGCGLLTTVSAERCYIPLQTAVPEAMNIPSRGEAGFVSWDDRMNLPKVAAVGFGPGLGRQPETLELLRKVLETYGGRAPIVIDADGLFALRQFLDDGGELPDNVILTPHPIELDRLTEQHAETVERIEASCLFAIRNKCTVVLKGAFSMTALSDGRRVFNTTGNSGMATAGAGDVLTGVILGLLAQGYPTDEAAILGVGLHAAAGDEAAARLSPESMTSMDISNHISDAYKTLSKL